MRVHFGLSLVAAFQLGAVVVAQAADPRPNIVVILADDLGNADVGYRGSDIKTPNIDKLASEGVRLKSFYGMPVCTPAARTDDWSVCHALWLADACDISQPYLWICRQTSARFPRR